MTTYYVSTSGDDANSGQSEAAAWETMARISGLFSAGHFLPSDEILLKRGDVWQIIEYEDKLFIKGSSGVEGNPIKIGAYGTGPRPALDAFGNRQAPIEHMREDAPADYIVIEGLEIRNWFKTYVRFLNVHHWILRDLYIHDVITDDWCCALGIRDGSYDVLVENCIIEDVQGEGIYCGRSEVADDTHHVMIRNCQFQRCDAEAVEMKDATHHITVRDCEIEDCGTDLHPSSDNSQFSVGGHDNLILDSVVRGTVGRNTCAIWLGRYGGGEYTDSGYHNRVEGCTIENATGEFGGVRLRGRENAIIGNTFINCTPPISGSQAGHIVEGNVIEGEPEPPDPPEPPEVPACEYEDPTAGILASIAEAARAFADSLDEQAAAD